MVSFTLTAVVAAASLLHTASAQTTNYWSASVTQHIETPTVTLPANALSTIGCFATPAPLVNYGSYGFQSPGNCQFICLELGKEIMGLSDGINCWCGDKIPAKDWQVSNSSCDTGCSGSKEVMCGGREKLLVILTGKSLNKPEYFNPGSSVSSVTKSAGQVTVTAKPSPTSQAPASSDSGPSKAGIAAGVVVGIVGLGAIIFGAWFFLRRRRQKQAEESYRRNAANADAFVNGGKLHTSNSSMNDTRLDPAFGDRRRSNGSIADNEDYSRRILKVTNA